MSFDADRLYELMPAVYRIRDARQGEPLRTLLSVIAEQVSVLEADLDQLYDDQFIETCAEWVTAYIGDLIGYRPLHGVAPRISSPRAEVANTIGFRRRKGTAAVLEQLARDVSGWNARVVEFFQLLATTQFMNHIRPNHFYAPNLRDWELLERLDTPFDKVAHTVDVRRIANRRDARFGRAVAGRGLGLCPDCRRPSAQDRRPGGMLRDEQGTSLAPVCRWGRAELEAGGRPQSYRECRAAAGQPGVRSP